jgi:anaerobic magnesium-protoporphyrin IX monomethyl ester cyclase
MQDSDYVRSETASGSAHSPLDLMLISPPLTVEERYAHGVGKRIGGDLPPLGIASLAAFVRERGYSVDVVDALALNLGQDEILRRIEANRPKIVGFSALTVSFHRAAACARVIRERHPDVLLVIGGHHATVMPREIMAASDGFDILVYGEGELTLLEILAGFSAVQCDRAAFLAKTETLGGIRGIAYRGSEGVVVTERRALIEDLDALPFPARDLLPMDRYLPLPNQYLRPPVVHMCSIRGCPFGCAFCSYNAVFGRRIRARTPARVVDEIEHVMERYGARELSFWDDTITAQRAWLVALCDEIVRRGLDIRWSATARVDSVDPELLARMRRAGCWNLLFGFESGDQALLDTVCKNITLDESRKACRWAREAGIEVRGSFMLALPGETPALARKTIDFAIELDPDYAQFSLTTPYPGTALWSMAESAGTLDRDFTKYHGWTAVFVPKGYRDRGEVERMARQAMRAFYLRPAFIWRALKKIRTWEDVKRHLKGFRMLLGFIA